MKKYFSFIILFLTITITGYFLWSETLQKSSKIRRTNFTHQEQEVLKVVRDIINNAYFTTFITRDENADAKARIMEPFAPDENFVIYLATNPRSRKVKEIQSYNKATLHYFDRSHTAYVSLYGIVKIEERDSIKKKLWKDNWKHFYKNRDKDYMLIKFEPNYLELISVSDGYTGNEKTWEPIRLNFLIDN